MDEILESRSFEARDCNLSGSKKCAVNHIRSGLIADEALNLFRTRFSVF